MSSSSLQSAIVSLRDAATNPDVWSEALPQLVEAFDGVGGCCFACNDQTGGIEWAQMFGPASTIKSDWIEHYSSFDLFFAALLTMPPAVWITLSDRLPKPLLRHNEWYEDFLRPSGIADAVAVQLHQAGSYRVYFGLHYSKAGVAPAATDASLRRVLPDLQQAARLGSVLRRSNLTAAIGTWALDHLKDAFFITYDAGRVVAMNAAAEHMLGHSQTLAVRHGRLVATDPSDARQLAALLAGAGQVASPDDRTMRMLTGGTAPRSRQVVTAFPLGGRLSADETALVGVRVISLAEAPSPDNSDWFASASLDPQLARLFDLSPAELRLARGLMRGRTLHELTTEFGLKMPTLRAQLRSILRKCGVQRQIDLVRLLLRAR